MTQERADEIIRKVFYGNFKVLPPKDKENRDFHIGRMIGKMQKTLEVELAREVEPQAESEDKDADSD